MEWVAECSEYCNMFYKVKRIWYFLVYAKIAFLCHATCASAWRKRSLWEEERRFKMFSAHFLVLEGLLYFMHKLMHVELTATVHSEGHWLRWL